MLDLDLFTWWAITITGGSIFLTLVSMYLYVDSATLRKKSEQTGASVINAAKDFVFVWVLLGLLVFYIVSIQIGSAGMFAAGNLLVEAFLTVYLLRNGTKEPRSMQLQDQIKHAENEEIHDENER